MRWIQRLFNPKGALPVIALQVGANPVKREESVLNAAATQDCLPRKRVKLGREMYTICGIAEKKIIRISRFCAMILNLNSRV